MHTGDQLLRSNAFHDYWLLIIFLIYQISTGASKPSKLIRPLYSVSANLVALLIMSSVCGWKCIWNVSRVILGEVNFHIYISYFHILASFELPLPSWMVTLEVACILPDKALIALSVNWSTVNVICCKKHFNMQIILKNPINIVSPGLEKDWTWQNGKNW